MLLLPADCIAYSAVLTASKWRRFVNGFDTADVLNNNKPGLNFKDYASTARLSLLLLPPGCSDCCALAGAFSPFKPSHSDIGCFCRHC
jgi:hypothetical protein